MDTFDTMEESLSIIKMAERDSLTGVYSQTFFYHYAEREIHEHPYSDYDIIITNIEGFRLINEREGWKTEIWYSAMWLHSSRALSKMVSSADV